MKRTIPTLVITAALAIAADAPKPKQLTAEQRLQAAQAQLVLIQTGAQFQSVRTALESAEKGYRGILDTLRKEAGVAPGCDLNDKQEWQCPPAAAPAKEAPKK